jgi:hypothetical protein
MKTYPMFNYALRHEAGILGLVSEWRWVVVLRPDRLNPWAFTAVVKRPRGGADHSPPSGAEVGNEWSYASAPPCVIMAWCLGATLPLLLLVFRVFTMSRGSTLSWAS